jgi:hypothetical protein
MCVGVMVRRVIGDGQTIRNLKNLKVANPGRYRAMWIDVADMHGYAHAVYGGHMLFYDCLLKPCATVLQRRHIEPSVCAYACRTSAALTLT